jgi:hypothetical protein
MNVNNARAWLVVRIGYVVFNILEVLMIHFYISRSRLWMVRAMKMRKLQWAFVTEFWECPWIEQLN